MTHSPRARYGRVRLADGSVYYARLEGDQAAPFNAAPLNATLLDAAPWLGGTPLATPPGLAEAQLLCPLQPSKVLCVGRNYRAHAAELGNKVPTEPLLFFKPSSALLRSGGAVELPLAELSQRVEHEVELVVVVGSALRRADVAAAERAIFGYTVAGDITARDLQRSDRLWTRGKGFDTFCPCGPAVVTGVDASALSVQCRVNGELRQDGNTAAMVFSPAQVLAYASQVMTLNPGDVVLTGTPAGVGPLVAGDAVEMAIEHIGVLAFRVVAAAL